ncbi:hypothetical protein [Bacillus benzoevorans]|uniref:Coproporphyrinogen III oxidase n=1 Tax=Bacillus benzoevorans TaxID=1456 RepID=A0A7X0LW67_9BACI|nr:hypothetical protein [Bacillus benzoevorans]MBB6446290.1 coproporphyrinogen III oxidase [Bacillus benzoevorans]
MESYSILNPIVWTLFIGGNLIILLAIKWFHSRYPHFSEVGDTGEQLLVKEIMLPASTFPDKTRTIVNSEDSISSLYPLFLKYDEEYFYVRNQEGLRGIVSLDRVLGIDSKKNTKVVQIHEYSA